MVSGQDGLMVAVAVEEHGLQVKQGDYWCVALLYADDSVTGLTLDVVGMGWQRMNLRRGERQGRLKVWKWLED